MWVEVSVVLYVVVGELMKTEFCGEDFYDKKTTHNSLLIIFHSVAFVNTILLSLFLHSYITTHCTLYSPPSVVSTDYKRHTYIYCYKESSEYSSKYT